MKLFNQWLKSNAHKTEPPMTILDNTHLSVEETVARICHWIQSHLKDINA